MANISQQDIKTLSKVFLTPMSCFLVLTILGAQNFNRLMLLGTPDTLPTLSHSKHYYVKHYLLERCCSFFRP